MALCVGMGMHEANSISIMIARITACMYIFLFGIIGCGLLWTFVTLVALKLLVEFLVRYHHYLEYYRKKEKNGFKSTYNKDAKYVTTFTKN